MTAVLIVDVLNAIGGGGIVDGWHVLSELDLRPFTVPTGVTWPATEGDAVSWIDEAAVSEALGALWTLDATRAVTLGILGRHAVIDAVQRLAQGRSLPIVADWRVDDVWTDQEAFRERILPLLTLLVTSCRGATALTGLPIHDRVDQRRAARTLSHLGATWVVLYDEERGHGDEGHLLWGPHYETWLTGAVDPGIGGRLSAALSAAVARGDGLPDAMPAAWQRALRI
ncbi:MAG: bifunctional hydroxymethylpyrimidine kinase/phosphomethylpyrimidine kinase [Firmicutes bacterium]|nr:bifunctional hydroxymethylpyrimidine kinase/phosphomethylpyrimidine kinase [Bacillota bacterium]